MRVECGPAKACLTVCLCCVMLVLHIIHLKIKHAWLFLVGNQLDAQFVL